MKAFVLPLIWGTLLLFLEVNCGAIGKAWDISPSSSSDLSDRPAWLRSQDSSGSRLGSAFEIRSVSGVGHLTVPRSTIPRELSNDHQRSRRGIEDFEETPPDYIEDPNFQYFLRNRRGLEVVEEFEEAADDGWIDYERFKRNVELVENPTMHHFTIPHIENLRKPRVRREAELTKMEKISGTKNVREARLNSPETWSKQPLSIELRHRSNSDQLNIYDKENQAVRGSHQAPKADFITGHRRDFPESRESREMPALVRAYPDYVPLFQEKVRERDFDVHIPRRYNFGSDRDFDGRRPGDSPYYYNRYNEEDIKPYGRALNPSKPKRIIYYAHLPEVARKPVDLRNYRGYPYDDIMVRSPPVAVASSTSYSRTPGNRDPNNYRYRIQYPAYDAYRPYRSDPYRRPYDGLYQSRTDEDHYPDRAALKEDPERDMENERGVMENKSYGRVSDRAEARLPWPVQVGTQVNVKDDERIPGRRIFGQNNDDYERYHVSAKLQTAPESGNSDDQRKSDQ